MADKERSRGTAGEESISVGYMYRHVVKQCTKCGFTIVVFLFPAILSQNDFNEKNLSNSSGWKGCLSWL